MRKEGSIVPLYFKSDITGGSVFAGFDTSINGAFTDQSPIVWLLDQGTGQMILPSEDLWTIFECHIEVGFGVTLSPTPLPCTSKDHILSLTQSQRDLWVKSISSLRSWRIKHCYERGDYESLSSEKPALSQLLDVHPNWNYLLVSELKETGKTHVVCRFIGGGKRITWAEAIDLVIADYKERFSDG